MAIEDAPSGEVQALLARGQLEPAVATLRRELAQVSVCVPGHGLLASVLLRLGQVAEAEEVLLRAGSLGAGSADAYDGLAWIALALGQHERSNALYRRAAEVAPGEPRFLYNLACSERSFGRLEQAEAICDAAIALDPMQYACYLLRSELRVQSTDANHIAALEQRLAAAPTDYRAQVFLGYALGKELDDLGRWDEAFRWFSLAAHTRRARLSYDVATDEHKLRRIAEVYSRDAVTSTVRPAVSKASGDIDSTRYIFIVGLPRSGTTLLERILTGLPGTRSNGETDRFSGALLAAATGPGDVFARAAQANPAAVARHYARLADEGAPAERIIEKLPLNYLYLGAIRRALPDAKIVLVSRAPLDSCFAMYRTLFAAGYPFSYDLTELARYYAAYSQLVAHWRTVLGDAVHEVLYEQLVRDPRSVGAQVARHCGLTWNDGAVEIRNNRSVSLTASAAQVRRPIYGSSSGRWRHYQANLRPLIETLRAHGVAVDA